MLEALDGEDIANVLGNQQITILQQDKTIRILRERVAELEAAKAETNGCSGGELIYAMTGEEQTDE